MELSTILGWLAGYGYFLLLPVSIFEGPMVTVLAGFLARSGVFNPVVVFWIIMLGDVLGDAFYYQVGKVGKHAALVRIGKRLGFKGSEIEHVEHQFRVRGRKLLVMGKYTEGMGTIMLIAAGAGNYPYRDFMLWNILLAMPKVLGCVLLGWYFGEAYEQLGTFFVYANEAALLGVLLLLGGWFWYSRRQKKEELEEIEELDTK